MSIFYWSRIVSKREGASLKSIKKRLYDGSCSGCHLSFDIDRLEIHHVYPVCLVGEIENFHLLCVKCHKLETVSQSSIESLFKKLGIVNKEGFRWWSFFSQDERMQIYIDFKKVLDENNRRKRDELL